MSVQYPYRTVICGDEHIARGWQGRKLITDRGSFFVGHIYGNWRIQDYRIFEVATIQSDGKDGWLVNGKPLSILRDISLSARFQSIPNDENLRVRRDRIFAAAWVDTGRAPNVTELLDEIVNFWKTAALPPVKSEEEPSFSKVLGVFSRGLLDVSRYQKLFPTWSKPIWLTEFRSAGQPRPLSPEGKRLAKITADFEETKAQLRKTESVAGDNLKEALSKWMKFDPPGMLADTKARISKAVQMYLTEPGKHSLAKVASEFGVSRKTVSVWFKTFTTETGYPVVTFRRHESVREHFQADSEQEKEQERLTK